MRREGKPHIWHQDGIWLCKQEAWAVCGYGFVPKKAFYEWRCRVARRLGID